MEEEGGFGVGWGGVEGGGRRTKAKGEGGGGIFKSLRILNVAWT